MHGHDRHNTTVLSVIQGGAKRTHVFEMGSIRESFFLYLGLHSTQKFTFGNLVQSTI